MAASHTGDTGPAAGEDAAYCQQMRLLLDRVGEKWSLLAVIALRGQARRFNQLRRELSGVSPRMLARTLRGLERDGLVERIYDKNDRRRVSIRLTELGQARLDQVMPDYYTRLRQCMAGVSEVERDMLHGILDKLGAGVPAFIQIGQPGEGEAG